MFRSLFFACALFTSSAFALSHPGSTQKRGYDIKMQLFVNNKKIASPRVQVLEGTPGGIEQKTKQGTLSIDLLATEGAIQGHQGILMNFIVSYVTNDGQKDVLSKPQILAQENSEAEISVAGSNSESFKLKVLAKRKLFK